MTATTPAISPLRDLITTRSYWRWSAAAQLTRLPTMMTSLAFVLAGTAATGRYAVGGLMVAMYVIAQVCSGPFAGRLLDRIGPATGAMRLLGTSFFALTGLTIAVAIKAPAPVLMLLAALAGALTGGIGGAMRTLLSAAVPHRLLGPALAIDATMVEIVVVTAPLLVSVAAIPTPTAAIAAMAAIAALATFLMRGVRDRAGTARGSGPALPHERWTWWTNPRYLFWLLVSVAFGHALGTAETCALPLSLHLGGGTGRAAGLVAALAITSALSGVAYAAFSHHLAAGAFRQAHLLLAALILGSLVLGLASGWPTAVGAFIALGLCTAPLNTVRSQAVEAEIPSARRTEAFSILFAANGVGFALGGLFLAALPLHATLAAGGASGIIALLASPLLLRRRRRAS